MLYRPEEVIGSHRALAEVRSLVLLGAFDALRYPERYSDYMYDPILTAKSGKDSQLVMPEHCIKDATISADRKAHIILAYFKPIAIHLFGYPVQSLDDDSYERTVAYAEQAMEKWSLDSFIVDSQGVTLPAREILPSADIVNAMILTTVGAENSTKACVNELAAFIDRTFHHDPNFPRFAADVA